jgi:uncharacterized protein
MREREGWRNPLGRPRGEPERPLAEAGIAFAALYLGAYLPLGQSLAAESFASAAYQAAMIAVNASRMLLALYFMSVGEGLEAFGLRRFRPIDLAKASLAALGALAAAVPLAMLFSALGAANPIAAAFKEGPRISLALAPLFLASSMATGYSEELFFRPYLMRRLGRAGMPPLWAAVASSLLFGGAHGSQGVAGIVSTFAVGLWFAWRWHSGRNVHEIAIGHGLYDAAVFAIAAYS